MTTIGQKDKEGNLLILGGWLSDLYQGQLGYYILQDSPRSKEAGLTNPDQIEYSKTRAVEVYNQLNMTKLPLDYIERWYESWTKKLQERNKEQVDNLLDYWIPSNSDPSKLYHITGPNITSLKCTCQGFKFRHNCSHIEQVKEKLNVLS